jgi:hypothetical protein
LTGAVAQLYLVRMLQRTLPAGFIALPSGGQWLLKMKNPGCSAVKREAEELGALTSPAGIYERV